ncbi:MAG TPA: AtpZ/AtpI family protein [Vicinamibacterales bacterium]|nr:AtpZ/AtpI family protein [Vicinamibacterales bacterium]
MAVTPDSRTLKTIGQLSTVGLSFVFALMMGFGAGFWLDGRLGTKPWLSLLGFAVGLAAGILNVVRTMQSVAAGERSLQRDRHRDPERPEQR